MRHLHVAVICRGSSNPIGHQRPRSHITLSRWIVCSDLSTYWSMLLESVFQPFRLFLAHLWVFILRPFRWIRYASSVGPHSNEIMWEIWELSGLNGVRCAFTNVNVTQLTVHRRTYDVELCMQSERLALFVWGHNKTHEQKTPSIIASNKKESHLSTCWLMLTLFGPLHAECGRNRNYHTLYGLDLLLSHSLPKMNNATTNAPLTQRRKSR